MIAPLPPGTLVFNRYRVVGLAGQGEFGLTYLTQDQKRFDELCILQEFTPLQQDPAGLERSRQYFHQEAALLYELQHPQLPHYRIMFIHADRLYLVRDYIVGKSYSALLNERRTEGRAFSQVEVMQLLVQTLPVLAHLHQLGMMHENLSLQSIVVQREEHIPVLINLGIVKRLTLQLQLHPVLPHTPIAKPGYAAPEQEKTGMAEPGSDIFGLGAIAVSLLLGKEPQESPQRWLKASNWETVTGVYPEFARILKRMLHPNPQKRFLSAPQVLRALEPIASIIAQVGVVDTRMPVLAVPAAPAPATPPLPAPAPPPPRAASALAAAPPKSRSRPPASRRPKTRAKADFKASAILVVSVALLVSVVSFRALSWVQAEPEKTPAPANTIASPADPGTSAASPAASPTPPSPPQMPTRETGATEATGGTGSVEPAAELNADFLSSITDELFYAKYPNLAGQKLTDDQQDLQNEWKAISADVSSKLSGLSPEVRRKLGQYQRSDYDRWTAPDSGASLNSRELNVLVNNRFAELFPDQKGKSLNPQTFGQVWYALAEEELNKLKPAN